jgi:microcystin-dependent protein
MWTAGAAPSSWLLCYGQEVSRSTYSALFAVISITFGSGNGSTTFNVPDMRGRVAIGKDNLGGSSANRVTNANADTIGGAGGAETHTLAEAEIPQHSHTFSIRQLASSASANLNVPAISGATFTSGYIGNTGSGWSHNNLQPWITIAFIIYAGA